MVLSQHFANSKKKERVGNFKNNGRKWWKKGQAPRVNVHDFPSLAEGTAIPYGAYDVHRNEGMVNVGMTHDTAEFAVASIRRWWRQFGIRHYPAARHLFICADSGGSNAARNRAWKYYLQKFSDEAKLEIVVGHYPPGTSNVACIVMRSLPLTGRSSGSFRRLFTPHKSDAL